ncbi:hypothetical protein CAAN1_04S05160 [[Candida] anglica]|uniref:DNA damage checkpoint protein LCD1 n=1 Tax=[Candida] anglica TaxID=148631 RepID=A0ABP0ED05_9ASCO
MTSSDNDFDDDDDEFLLALPTNKSQVTQSREYRDNIATQSSGVDNISLNNTTHATSIDPEIQARLYRADGEISILRDKFETLQSSRQHEINNLKASNLALQRSHEEQLKALQFTVQKLEDEKKFLSNEIKGISTKRRKVSQITNGGPMGGVDSGYSKPQPIAFSTSTPNSTTNSISKSISQSPGQPITLSGQQTNRILHDSEVRSVVPQKIIRIQNDSSLFTDHIWNHCINGAQRKTLTILGKVYIDFDILIGEFKYHHKTSIAGAIIDFLMLKKNLRLDNLVAEFTDVIMEVVKILLEKNTLLAVPFLLSLIHAAINFRPAAVVKTSILSLLGSNSHIALQYIFLLESVQNQEDYITYHDVSEQVSILEKFTLICSLDIIEKLASLSSLYGAEFIHQVWTESIPNELLMKCLPENTERFKSTAQINMVFNMVEILMSSITESTFAYSNNIQQDNPIGQSNSTIFNSLLKVFLIDIPIKDDFMFYGLNRIIGNNIDLEKVSSVIPESETPLGNTLVCIPCPIPYYLSKERMYIEDESVPKYSSIATPESTNRHLFEFKLNSRHEFHLLTLRVRVASFIECYILNTCNTKPLQSRDHIKSIVRTIGFEQTAIMRAPRSETIHLRTSVISILVRILHYISSESRGITALVYPETVYEIFVTLSRIAFGSNSLSSDAHKLLATIRRKGYLKEPIFHKWCEKRARQLNHIEHGDISNATFIADIESQFANGLEFPYEEETIELSREILDSCVTHEEADNLFFNMNYEDPNFDEMDLVDN